MRGAGAGEATLLVLQQAASKYNAMLAKTPSIWPIYGLITSDFGWRANPSAAAAASTMTALTSRLPTALPSARPRTARSSRRGGTVEAGISVTVYHRDGIETLYGHMSRVIVKAGQTVTKGSGHRVRGVDRARHRRALPLSGHGERQGRVRGPI